MELTVRGTAASVRVAAAARRVAMVATLALWSAGAAAEDEAPSAVPYRPSVSTPAALSAPGWLEVEAGYLHQHDAADRRRDSLPATFKLAFTPDWGVRISSDGWVRQRDETGGHASGFGDTGFVVKRRFAVDEESAFGLEGSVLVPTSAHNVGSGSGKPDWGLNAIYSADFGAWHTDLNAAATRIGANEAGTSRALFLGAASLSRSLDEHWGLVGEISGTHQQGAESSSQLLVATSYNVSKRLVLDAGAARSLRHGTPTWSAFTGFTWLAARVF